MSCGNAWFNGTESSPISASKTLRKNGPASDFGVIRQKVHSVDPGACGKLKEHQDCRQTGEREVDDETARTIKTRAIPNN